MANTIHLIVDPASMEDRVDTLVTCLETGAQTHYDMPDATLALRAHLARNYGPEYWIANVDRVDSHGSVHVTLFNRADLRDMLTEYAGHQIAGSCAGECDEHGV